MSLNRLEALGERISKFDKEKCGLKKSIIFNTPLIMKYIYKELKKSPLFKNNLLSIQFCIDDLSESDDIINGIMLVMDNKNNDTLNYLRLLDDEFINYSIHYTDSEDIVDYVINIYLDYVDIEKCFYNVFDVSLENLILLIKYLDNSRYLLEDCFGIDKIISCNNKFEISDR